MPAQVIQLFGPRTFTPSTKGEQKWCAHCGMREPVHRLIECRVCGGSFRACLLNTRGLLNCSEHAS